MKQILLLLLSVLGVQGILIAQDGCGVLGAENFAVRLYQNQPNLERIEQEFIRNIAARTLTPDELPVQFHIVRSNGGTSPLTSETVNQAMANLNGYFQKAGIRFYQCGLPKYIDDSYLQNYQIAQQAVLVARSYVDSVINIYCVGTIEGGTVAGYTYLPGSGQPDLIVMDDGILTTPTLTHEMGHYFGLLHTHGSSNCANRMPATNELVNGSNCNTAGDYVCDTPADPGLLGLGCLDIQVDANCVYTGTSRDANGAAFSPDVRNIMSYSRSGCRDRLSSGQYARIYSTYKEFRTYLKCSGTVALSRRLSLTAPIVFSPTPVRTGKVFSVSTRVQNTGNTKFTGKVQATLFNRQGQSIGILGSKTISDTLAPGAVHPSLLEFSSSNILLQQETYKVGIYVIADGSTSTELAGNENYPSYVDLIVEGEPLPCNPPDSVRLAEAGEAHVLFEWASSAIQSAYYRASYREKGSPTWIEVSNWSAARMVIVNRKRCTEYEFRVKTICPDGESDWSSIVTGKTGGCGATYCATYGNSLKNFIQEVSIGTIENISGNNYGYKDFTELKTTVCAGGFISFTLVPGVSSNEIQRPVYWRVWADLNKDNDFVDANELLFQTTEMNNREVSVIWQLPDNVSPGTTRLRISMDAKAYPSPCSINDTRDVEDYGLEICGTVTLELNPSQLDFPSAGGTATCSLLSDQNWEAIPAQTWLTVSKTSGNAGTHALEVEAKPNSGVLSRNGSVTFRSNFQSKRLPVWQKGLLVSTDQLLATATGKTLTLQLNADTSWVLKSKPDWVAMVTPLQGTGVRGTADMLTITCLPNALETSRTGFLVFEWADGYKAEVEIIQEKNVAPFAWTSVQTGQNHLVLISNTLKTAIGGLPLLPGDYIGFFFKDGAQLRCGGYARWTAALDVVPVYADDPGTAVKDGFAPGETFRVRIWRLATGTEVGVNAVFAAVKAGAIQTHTYRYALNGISMLSELNTDQPITVTLQMNAGFDLFSLPVIPQDPDFTTLLKPVQTSLQEVQDYLGLKAQPAAGINKIGDADVQQGYVSKASAAVRLDITGVPVVPSKYPIAIQPGWQIIPFWSTAPKPVAEALAGISSSIVLVKDLQGRNYIPAYGINTIGDFLPGKGYWLMASGPDTLVYPDMYMNLNIAKLEPRANTLETARHFKVARKNELEVGATLAVLADGIDPVVQPGDEIAVVDPTGRVVGASVYEGENLAINVYGMQPGAPYSLRIWKVKQNQSLFVTPRFSRETQAVFLPGTLGVIEGLEVENVSVEEEATSDHVQVFPNPARESVMVEFPDLSGYNHTVRLMRADGQVVRAWEAARERYFSYSLKGLPPGPYFIQIAHPGGVWVQKLWIE